MLLPLACLKRDFLKVLQSLRGYIDTILPKSLGHIARVAYRQACPEAVVHGLSCSYPSYIDPEYILHKKCINLDHILENQI